MVGGESGGDGGGAAAATASCTGCGMVSLELRRGDTAHSTLLFHLCFCLRLRLDKNCVAVGV